MHCREREWEGYGYGLLWLFVQDSPEQVHTMQRCGMGGGEVGAVEVLVLVFLQGIGHGRG